VEEGEKTSRFLEKKLLAAREIADRLNRIVNDTPRKLRESCEDADLRHQEHRLRIARNRAGELVNGLRSTADNERRRWGRVIKAASGDFGVHGTDWKWLEESGLEIVRPGAGRSGLERAQLAQVQREHAQALARAAEELALVESDLADAERAWEDAKAAYEKNREARTWSVH